MSDIFFECSNCAQPLIVEEEGRGQTIECPECAHEVLIPEDAPLVDIEEDEVESPVAGESEEVAVDAQPDEEGGEVLASIENVRFGCPTCQQLLEVGVDALGMQLDCPSCGNAMMAPSHADVISANLTEIVAGEEEAEEEAGGFGYLPPRREPVEDTGDGTLQPTLRRSEYRDEDQLKPRMAASTPVGNLPTKKRPAPDRSDDAREGALPPRKRDQRPPAPAGGRGKASVRAVEEDTPRETSRRTVKVEPMRRSADQGEEMERMRAAMGEEDLEVKRVAGTETMVVLCPECHQRYVLNFRMAGSEYVCRGCHATLMLPRPDRGKAATVVGKGERPTQAPERHAHRQRVNLPSRKGIPAPVPKEESDDRRAGPMGGRPSAMLEGGRIPTPSEMKQWGDVDPAVQRPKDFRGAFLVVTVIVVLGGLISWGIVSFAAQQRRDKEARENRTSAPDVVATSGADALEREMADRRAGLPKLSSEKRREQADLVDKVVREVLAAGDLASMLRHCERPERVARKMKDFYARSGGYQSFVNRFGAVEAALPVRRETHNGREYQMVRVTFEGKGTDDLDSPILEIAVRLMEGEAKVDWHQLEHYSEMSLEEMARIKPTEAQELRMTVDLRAEYYNFGFSEDDWYSLYLFDPTPGVEATLPVYVKRDTPEFEKVKDVILSYAGNVSQMAAAPMTLKVRYVESEEYRGFVVDDVVAPNWILP